LGGAWARDDSMGERTVIYHGGAYLLWWLRVIQAA
jgi:hypothetical protein